MYNANIVFFGLLFLLYSQGAINLTQLFLLLALMSTTSCCCQNLNNDNNNLNNNAFNNL